MSDATFTSKLNFKAKLLCELRSSKTEKQKPELRGVFELE